MSFLRGTPLYKLHYSGVVLSFTRIRCYHAVLWFQSCPAISAYSDDNLEQALDSATKSFCKQEIIVLPKNEEVYISKIFEWYESDFGKDDVSAIK